MAMKRSEWDIQMPDGGGIQKRVRGTDTFPDMLNRLDSHERPLIVSF